MRRGRAGRFLSEIPRRGACPDLRKVNRPGDELLQIRKALTVRLQPLGPLTRYSAGYDPATILGIGGVIRLMRTRHGPGAVGHQPVRHSEAIRGEGPDPAIRLEGRGRLPALPVRRGGAPGSSDAPAAAGDAHGRVGRADGAPPLADPPEPQPSGGAPLRPAGGRGARSFSPSRRSSPRSLTDDHLLHRDPAALGLTSVTRLVPPPPGRDGPSPDPPGPVRPGPVQRLRARQRPLLADPPA